MRVFSDFFGAFLKRRAKKVVFACANFRKKIAKMRFLRKMGEFLAPKRAFFPGLSSKNAILCFLGVKHVFAPARHTRFSPFLVPRALRAF